MKRFVLLSAVALSLAACGSVTYEPIIDYTSPRTTAKPEQLSAVTAHCASLMERRDVAADQLAHVLGGAVEGAGTGYLVGKAGVGSMEIPAAGVEKAAMAPFAIGGAAIAVAGRLVTVPSAAQIRLPGMLRCYEGQGYWAIDFERKPVGGVE